MSPGGLFYFIKPVCIRISEYLIGGIDYFVRLFVGRVIYQCLPGEVGKRIAPFVPGQYMEIPYFRIESRVVVKRDCRFLTYDPFCSSYDDDAVGCPRPVNGRRRSIFKNIHRLYIAGRQGLDQAVTFNGHPIHNV
ncbi:hypothetical protein SDC9_151183 [bioreactor metagenome]|uniref:Uncharacterized protein n=1 Tax=bioreactor metagenome TaxID=1076179 RepID=A0A645EPK7_9ZZZZ